MLNRGRHLLDRCEQPFHAGTLSYVHCMARCASYQIIQRPNGNFDIAVTLAGGRTHYREGLTTRAEVDTALTILSDLMAACGASLVEEPAIRVAAE